MRHTQWNPFLQQELQRLTSHPTLRYPESYSTAQCQLRLAEASPSCASKPVEARLSSVEGFELPAESENPPKRDTPPKSLRLPARQVVGALGLNPSHCHPDPMV